MAAVAVHARVQKAQTQNAACRPLARVLAPAQHLASTLRARSAAKEGYDDNETRYDDTETRYS